MRRTAIRFLASGSVLVLLVGCGVFGKKRVESQTVDGLSQPYEPVAYNEPARLTPSSGFEEPALEERTYPALADVSAIPTSSVSGARYHTVAKKDTLFKLARMYYNDASRWRDIYEANRGEVSDPDKIYVGQRLLIP